MTGFEKYAPGRTAVFLDVENLFRPFREHIRFEDTEAGDEHRKGFESAVEKSRRAAETMIGGRPETFEDVHGKGAEVAARLVTWFAIHGFTVAENHGRTYGNIGDRGVRAAWPTFVNEMDWNHVATRKGPDRADRSLLNDVKLFAGTGLDWVFVGSSDLQTVQSGTAEVFGDHPDVRLAAILLGPGDSVKRMREEPAFQRFDMRLYLWGLYNEVLHIERHAPGRLPRHAEAEVSAATSVAGRKRAFRKKNRHNANQRRQQQHDHRVQKVTAWSALPDTELTEAIRHMFATVSDLATVRTVGDRYSTAACELVEPHVRKRMLDLIGSALHQRITELDSSKER